MGLPAQRTTAHIRRKETETRSSVLHQAQDTLQHVWISEKVTPPELSLYLKQVVNRLLNLLLSPLQNLSQVQNPPQNQVLNQRQNQPMLSLSQWESQCFNRFLISPCLIFQQWIIQCKIAKDLHIKDVLRPFLSH